VDPVPHPLLLRKSGSARNRTRTSGSVARNSNHLTTEAVVTHFHITLKKVKFYLCVTRKAIVHEGIRKNGCIDPHFLDLGTSWGWVVSFTLRPLYLREKSPLCPLGSRLFGPGTGLDDLGKRRILPLPRLELWLLGRPVRSQLLYWLTISALHIPLEVTVEWSYTSFHPYVLINRGTSSNCFCPSPHSVFWCGSTSLIVITTKQIVNVIFMTWP
jgi:hypothetical protein